MSRKLSSTFLLGAGIWLLFVATNPGRNETLDVEMRRVVARQMWSAGRISISALPQDSRDTWIPAGTDAAGQPRWVAPYGVGQSLVFLPFDAAGSALERIGPPALRERVGWLPIGLGLLPLIGLAWWYATLRLLEAWGLPALPAPWPLAGATLMSLGTLVFHYSGQGQEESLVGLFLTLSLLFAVRLRRDPRWGNAVAAGLFAGLCLLTRPVSVFALLCVPAVIVAAGRDWRERVKLLAVAGIAVLAVMSGALLYNEARFGDPFTVGYDRLGHFTKLSLDARSPAIFLSLLLGPGFGLFVLSPALLFVLAGLPALWREDRWHARWYVGGFLAATAVCLLFFSSWHDSYTGGGAWGTRYQCHLLALFALPVTVGLRRLWESGARSLVLAVVVVSVLLQGISVFATYHLEVYQAACEMRSDAPFRAGLRDGQLGRRLENLGRWAAGVPVRAEGGVACRQAMDLMARRYVPNFWGPVFAHRLGDRGIAVLAVWLAMLVTSLALITAGLRGGLRGGPISRAQNQPRSGAGIEPGISMPGRPNS